MSPSAVFCRISQLEHQTGLKVYERVGKKLHLALTGRESAALAKVVRLPSAPDGNNPELERLWDLGRR